MKDNKKFLILIFALLLAGAGICMLLMPQQWQADKDGHYRFRLFDAKVAYEAHTLDGEKCTVCGAEIVFNSEGVCTVSQYNEHGHRFRYIRYQADGTVESERRGEFVYDETGNIRYAREYVDGCLSVEAEYEGPIAIKTWCYLKDGGREYEERDIQGRMIKTVSYDAQGRAGDVYTYEEEFLEGNTKSLTRTYVNGVLKKETLRSNWGCEGFPVLEKTEYHDDGSKTVYEYNGGKVEKKTTFDAAGNIIKQQLP